MREKSLGRMPHDGKAYRMPICRHFAGVVIKHYIVQTLCYTLPATANILLYKVTHFISIHLGWRKYWFSIWHLFSGVSSEYFHSNHYAWHMLSWNGGFFSFQIMVKRVELENISIVKWMHRRKKRGELGRDEGREGKRERNTEYVSKRC